MPEFEEAKKEFARELIIARNEQFPSVHEKLLHWVFQPMVINQDHFLLSHLLSPENSAFKRYAESLKKTGEIKKISDLIQTTYERNQIKISNQVQKLEFVPGISIADRLENIESELIEQTNDENTTPRELAALKQMKKEMESAPREYNARLGHAANKTATWIHACHLILESLKKDGLLTRVKDEYINTL